MLIRLLLIIKIISLLTSYLRKEVIIFLKEETLALDY